MDTPSKYCVGDERAAPVAPHGREAVPGQAAKGSSDRFLRLSCLVYMNYVKVFRISVLLIPDQIL